MGNKHKKNSIKKPIFELNKSFTLGSSIYYGYKLKDGRICLCICGSSFKIFNINSIQDGKEDILIDYSGKDK